MLAIRLHAKHSAAGVSFGSKFSFVLCGMLPYIVEKRAAAHIS